MSRTEIIGAVVFLIVFIFCIILSLIGIVLPPGDVIIHNYVPDIMHYGYSVLIEGIINGVIYESLSG